MAEKIDFQNWELTSKDKKKQPRPAGFVHNLILTLWMILSLGMMALGIYLIIYHGMAEDNKALAITALLAITGIIYVFGVATKTVSKPKRTLLLGFVMIACGAILMGLTGFVVTSYKIATGIIGIIISLFMFVDVIREVKDGVPYFNSLLWGIIYGAVSIAILFLPDGSAILSIVTGCYLILLGLNTFFECLTAFFYKHPDKKRSFVVTLPTFIAACLPMALFRELNTMVKEEPDEVLMLQRPDTGEEPPLIVYVHTRAGLIPGFGHCDLCFEGKVYSFGDYDEATWKLDGFIADGVLALIPPEAHIKMSLAHDKKILMAYGLQLTPELKEKVKGKLEDLMSKAYVWEPKAQLAKEGKIKGKPEDYTDVGSEMYLLEDAELYKFKEGSPYKTYYALGQNCSEVVNDVVGYSGIKLLKLNGIVTPGAYLEYLNELYETDNTIVTDRRVYMLDVNGRPVEYPLNPKDHFRLGDISM